ncbi:hypothetical protein Gohar_018505, partial [Gossypium harknessii]|nr:hypothetical protein [Gossypium harknessii]
DGRGVSRSTYRDGESFNVACFVQGDVGRFTIGIEDGLPSIRFSDRVHQIFHKNISRSVVVKLLGRKIRYQALLHKVYSLWKPSGPIRIMDLENDYFLIKLQSEDNYVRALTEGPWVVYGQYLTIQPWLKLFSPGQPFPSSIVVWIYFWGIPSFMYRKSVIKSIGEIIGRVIKLDDNTESVHMGCFAHMSVVLDLNKPLI